MKSEAFAHYNDMLITLIGLGLFIAVFVGWSIWVSLKSNREHYKRFAQQILDDGEFK